MSRSHRNNNNNCIVLLPLPSETTASPLPSEPSSRSIDPFYVDELTILRFFCQCWAVPSCCCLRWFNLSLQISHRCLMLLLLLLSIRSQQQQIVDRVNPLWPLAPTRKNSSSNSPTNGRLMAPHLKCWMNWIRKQQSNVVKNQSVLYCVCSRLSITRYAYVYTQHSWNLQLTTTATAFIINTLNLFRFTAQLQWQWHSSNITERRRVGGGMTLFYSPKGSCSSSYELGCDD